MKIKAFLLLITAPVFLVACSLDASLSDLSQIPGSIIENLSRKEPDFIAGEVVTTNSGVVVTGTFGEIVQKTKSVNGVEVEGVFYE